MTIDLQQRESRWVRKIRPCVNVLRNAELVVLARLTGGAGNYGIVPIGTCFLTFGLSPPYAGAVSLGQSFGEGAPAPLSGDKQSYRCTDQNQKSRKGRHNAYLFKDGHDPPPMPTPTRRARTTIAHG